MSESVTVATATASEAPMGTIIEMDRNGRVVSKSSKVARQVGVSHLVKIFFFFSIMRRESREVRPSPSMVCSNHFRFDVKNLSGMRSVNTAKH
jgi:hypothetical protein